MAQIGLLEDNVLIADVCATYLAHTGHQVAVFDTAERCFRALFSEEAERQDSLAASSPAPRLPVDILILDLGLPHVDGVEILRYLKTHPRTRALPIVLFTAAGQREVLRALEVAPQTAVVEKPFKMPTLIAAIEKALRTDSILRT